MPNESELDCILFEYRGLRFTFRLRADEQDVNGDRISDTYHGGDGTLRSRRYNELIQYGDIIADHLDAERAKGGIVQAARQAVQVAPLGATPHVPPMGATGGGGPTGYRAPPVADQVCPQCGGGLSPVKQTSKGGVRECLQQNGDCKNGRGYPTSVWLQQNRR